MNVCVCGTTPGQIRYVLGTVCRSVSCGITRVRMCVWDTRQGQIIRAAVKEMYQAGQTELRLRGNPFAALPDCPRDIPKGELFKKQIHRSDLKPVHVIGAGQYGEVYLALQVCERVCLC